VNNDIIKIECDAVVNSVNSLIDFGDINLLTGIAAHISKTAGQ